MELEEQSKNLTTITTHKGLFRFNRLSYGIASAPGLFQREMEKILQGLEGTAVYFNDVFITGTTREEHDKNVVEVLRRLQEAGLPVKKKNVNLVKRVFKFWDIK